MNIYLWQLGGKLIGLFVTLIASIFGTFDLEKQVINVNNGDKNKGLEVITTVIDYKTVFKYNEKVPMNNKKILVKGENGIIYQDKQGSTIKTLKEKIDEVVEIGTGKYGEYIGTLTLYGPDCDTCDGRGYVACPVNKKDYNLLEDGIYYEDKDFGKVRILAAALIEFPCGTIIEYDNKDTKDIGIVLDTGSALVNAYKNGNILIDLANKTEKDLPHGTNKGTKFSVKRWGW